MSDALPVDRAAARIAAVEQELADFSYIVSHDIAAPIRHVTAFSRLLLADLGEDLNPRQQAQAAQIRLAGDRCQAMIEQLLAFSRVQQKTLACVRQDATPAMRLAWLALGQEAQAAGAEVSIAPLGEVFADPELLALAFRHLLDNAVKFRRPGPAPLVRVEAAHDAATWRVRFIDNGRGVAPAYREKAFGMFQRLQVEDASPGVGAGLAVCRRIARRHGGDVGFLDCAEGACVELALPRAPGRP